MPPTEPPLPKYLTSALPLLSVALQPGTVTVVEVYHDDHCAHWRGAECDCAPDVRLVPVAPKGARP